MNIPLEPSKEKSIYDYGFDAGLNRDIPDNSTGVVYNSVEQTNTGSIVQGGNLNLKTLSIGGLVRQVAPGDDIQAAIDAINREGGGTVQLLAKTYLLTNSIYLRSSVALVGAGASTVLEFQSIDAGVVSPGTADLQLSDIVVANLTIQNSRAEAGLDFTLCDNFRVENVLVTSCNNTGVRFTGCRRFVVSNVRSIANTDDGFYFEASDTTASVSEFCLINCVATGNTGNGFAFHRTDEAPAITTGFFRFSVINCTSSTNADDGFDFSGDTSTANGFGRVIGCQIESNGISGIDVNEGIYLAFVANYVSGSGTGAEIDVATGGNTFVANNLPTGDVNDSAGGNVMVGNLMGGRITNTDEGISIGNVGNTAPSNKDLISMKNTTGATLRTGSVVILKSVAAGDEVTTTTTNGDNKVYGILSNASGNSTADNAYGLIQTLGKTTTLFANNSAASIAIGDWLSTYSHAYYAKKAVAGDMVFAMALEAPSTGTAQIDALLVTPRLI